MAGSENPLRNFWREAFSFRTAVTQRVLLSVAVFGLISSAIYWANRYYDLSIEVGPHEVAGLFLGLLLVLRTNSGYERWWEARKLWGGIVNQSRNLALAALAYGPADRTWREQIVRWTAAFPHATRARLRQQQEVPELVSLLGAREAARVCAAEHMPGYVALRIAQLLQDGCVRGMDRFGFLQADRERVVLIDHLGGCERILRTPLAAVLSITTRRFIVVYLATLPFALLHKFEEEWLAPLVTVFVAILVLSLDQIGVELQHPFSLDSLGCLPLDELCRSIEKNLLALLEQAEQDKPAAGA